MKSMTQKRGFTIVELVIVIAVIAILAAVLIPSFAGIVGKAKESSAMQEANSAMTVVFGQETGYEVGFEYYVIVDNEYWFVRDGQTLDKTVAVADATFAEGDVVYVKTAELPSGFNAIAGLEAEDITALSDISTGVVVWKKAITE